MGDVPKTQEPGFSRFATLSRCPECHSVDLEAVIDGAGVNFFCRACARCWHLELNRVIRVDPATCAGCGHAGECTERFAADHDGASVGA